MGCEVVIEKKISMGERVQLLPLDEYDKIIVSESGGKDSVACALYLLEQGVRPERMELWHQSVDGRFEDQVDLMDWPVTESYVEAFGQLYGIKVAFQWRASGIYGELMRRDSLTGDIYYCEGGEVIHLPTKSGKKSTRLRWPAMGADLRTRWCSPYVKIDVFRRVLNNHPDFKGTKEQPKKILVITGERREESPNRAKYNEIEVHACNSNTRLVHAWRPVIDWNEQKIWSIYEKHSLLPHPAYLLGWSRTSCFGCIFSTADLWAMMREIAPERFERISQIEKELNHTIDTNRLTVEQKANLGSLKRLPNDERTKQWVQIALNRSFKMEDLKMQKWELPAGAFRGSEGGSI